MKHAALLATALFATILAGCSRSEPEPPPLENIAEDNVETLDTAPAETPVPLETATPDRNATADLPPEEPSQPDEQMLDDASATGMTARAQRDEPTGDATAPAAEHRQ